MSCSCLKTTCGICKGVAMMLIHLGIHPNTPKPMSLYCECTSDTFCGQNVCFYRLTDPQVKERIDIMSDKELEAMQETPRCVYGSIGKEVVNCTLCPRSTKFNLVSCCRYGPVSLQSPVVALDGKYKRVHTCAGCRDAKTV